VISSLPPSIRGTVKSVSMPSADPPETCQSPNKGAGPFSGVFEDLRTKARADGLTRFFTGNPCKYGHIAERLVSCTRCVVCMRKSRKKYKLENPDAVKASKARWHQKYLEDRKKKLASHRAANLEHRRAKSRSRYASDREKFIAQSSAWQKANPEFMRAKWAKRRARIRGAGGSYTASQVKMLFLVQKKKCANPFCRTSLTKGYHADHIMPLVLGGRNDIQNIQLLCASCNLSKHTKHPIEWAQSIGLLI
jgi:5-methylcytosine-specific restriction endonuclease McrA